MIKLKQPCNFGGELHPVGAVVNLPPNIANRMIENGYATRYVPSVDVPTDIPVDVPTAEPTAEPTARTKKPTTKRRR